MMEDVLKAVKEEESKAERKGEELGEILYRKSENVSEFISLLESMGFEDIKIKYVGGRDNPEEIIVTVGKTPTFEFYENNPELKEELGEGPACVLERGLFKKATELRLGSDVEIEEVKCRVAGDDVCEFRIKRKG